MTWVVVFEEGDSRSKDRQHEIHNGAAPSPDIHRPPAPALGHTLTHGRLGLSSRGAVSIQRAWKDESHRQDEMKTESLYAEDCRVPLYCVVRYYCTALGRMDPWLDALLFRTRGHLQTEQRRMPTTDKPSQMVIDDGCRQTIPIHHNRPKKLPVAPRPPMTRFMSVHDSNDDTLSLQQCICASRTMTIQRGCAGGLQLHGARTSRPE